jgi:polar amino acid transport system substrate-binding protein
VLLEYPERDDASRATRVDLASPSPVPAADVAVGFLGAGNFAQSYLLPPLVKAGVPLRGVATSRPVSASSVAGKFGFAFAATDPAEVVEDDATTAVFIATRHDSHAGYVTEALAAGRHVFVEKPLAVTPEQLASVTEAAAAAVERGLYLAVGFNRRFSQPFRDIQAFFAGRREPMAITYRINAGRIPHTSWIQASDQGGRIVGEGCHFVDVFQALTGARPQRVFAQAAQSHNVEAAGEDTATIVIVFDDGSIATLLYLANGDESVPKEWCEVSAGGKTAVMQNFTRVELHEGRSRSRRKYSGDKGHAEEVADFLAVVRGRSARTFGVESLVDTTAVTFAAVESIRTNEPVEL